MRLPLERFRPLGDPTRHLDALLTLVSRAKDEDVSPAAYQAWAEGAGRSREDARSEGTRPSSNASWPPSTPVYQALLAEAGVVDFGDQIFRTLALLRESPALLAKLRARYRYILVDEFQDTNHAQLEMVRLLAGQESPEHHGRRRRRPGHLPLARGGGGQPPRLPRAVSRGCREVVLTENHRSTQVILDAAARLISYNNPYRLEVVAGIDKRLRAQRPGGAAVRHVHYDTVSAEADGVAALIDERLLQGFRPRDVAILVRSNNDADAVPARPQRARASRTASAAAAVCTRARRSGSWSRSCARSRTPTTRSRSSTSPASELYRVPEIDLLRLNHYAARKSRPLLEVLRGLPTNEDLVGVGGAAREAAARLLADLDRAAADVPRMRTGEVLYSFLQASGPAGAAARARRRRRPRRGSRTSRASSTP